MRSTRTMTTLSDSVTQLVKTLPALTSGRPGSLMAMTMACTWTV
ncbi:MAG: hypothetical protein ACK55Z_04680 [bacterium]